VMIPNAHSRFGTQSTVTYLYASEHLKLLDYRNRRLKLNRLSPHADILKERHETGTLAELSPWRAFQDADVFLYLRSVLEPDEFNLWKAWRPWSAILLGSCPAFLLEAVDGKKAIPLLEALNVPDIATFRSRLKERAGGLYEFFGSRNPFYHVFEGLDPDSIGTK
jgi:hypothetical protein